MKNKEYIKKYFSYNPDTGVISREDRRNSNGSYDHYGYLIIKIKGVQHKAHRIAWFLYYNEEPPKMIDHINKNKSDNRIENLRVCDYKINNNNSKRKPNKDTGVIGVCIDNTKGLNKKYVVRTDKKTHRFYTLKDAIAFRIKLNKQI